MSPGSPRRSASCLWCPPSPWAAEPREAVSRAKRGGQQSQERRPAASPAPRPRPRHSPPWPRRLRAPLPAPTGSDRTEVARPEGRGLAEAGAGLGGRSAVPGVPPGVPPGGPARAGCLPSPLPRLLRPGGPRRDPAGLCSFQPQRTLSALPSPGALEAAARPSLLGPAALQQTSTSGARRGYEG